MQAAYGDITLVIARLIITREKNPFGIVGVITEKKESKYSVLLDEVSAIPTLYFLNAQIFKHLRAANT